MLRNATNRLQVLVNVSWKETITPISLCPSVKTVRDSSLSKELFKPIWQVTINQVCVKMQNGVNSKSQCTCSIIFLHPFKTKGLTCGRRALCSL